MAEKTGKRVRAFFLEGEWVVYDQEVIDSLSEEGYDVLHQDSENQLKHMWRDGRCSVPGKSGKTIRCPDKNKCEKCPYGITYEGDSEYVQPGEQTGRPLSLEYFIENGGRVASSLSVEEECAKRARYEVLRKTIAMLSKRDQCIASLWLVGMSEREISTTTGLKQRCINYRKNRVIRPLLQEKLEKFYE